MTPQELKNSILQRAIQGKLVEQRPEEGTGEELYKQIQSEKARLIKEGKLKKEKPLPPISEEEIPFDIPESWKWVTLNGIAETSLGKTLDKAKNTGEECPYLCSINVYAEGINLSVVKTAKFTDEDRNKYLLKKGDMLICEGGDAGRCSMWDRDEEMYYQNALHRVRFYGDIEVKYFLFFFHFIKDSKQLNAYTKGETIKHLVQGSLYSIPIPLPPLSEQKRIVAKIEELMPLVEQYEKAYNRVEQLNKQFPDDMKKSILQLAIQGNLVEQRPEEGTGEELYKQIQAEKARLIKEGKLKKEKPLPAISEDEIPFDIPDSWKLVRLAELCKSVSDGDHQPPPQVPNGVPFLVISNVSNGFLDFSHTRFVPSGYYRNLPNEKIAEYGDILFTVTGSYGIPVKVNSNTRFCFQRHMALLKLISDWDYLYYALKSPVVKTQCDEAATGTAQKTVGLNSLRNILIPLPPLAEQKRIVAKIEELLPLCDLLNRKWT